MPECPVDLAVILEAATLPLRTVEIHSRIELITGDDLLSEQDLTALRLTFASAFVWIMCLGASDEVHVSLARPPWPSGAVTDITATQPWHTCEGMALQGASLLTNSQGYTDAVQLHFVDDRNADKHSRVQVEAVASRFWFWQVTGPFTNDVPGR